MPDVGLQVPPAAMLAEDYDLLAGKITAEEYNAKIQLRTLQAKCQLGN